MAISKLVHERAKDCATQWVNDNGTKYPADWHFVIDFYGMLPDADQDTCADFEFMELVEENIDVLL